jgi:hypothetical protein
MSKGLWSVRSTELAHFVKAVKATGLPVRNVEFSTETKLVRVNVGPPERELAVESSEKQEDFEDLRKLL